MSGQQDHEVSIILQLDLCVSKSRSSKIVTGRHSYLNEFECRSDLWTSQSYKLQVQHVRTRARSKMKDQIERIGRVAEKTR